MFWILACARPVEVQESPLSLDAPGTVTVQITDEDVLGLVLRGDAELAIDAVTGPDGPELSWDPSDDEQQTQAVRTVDGETVLVWPVYEGTWLIEVNSFGSELLLEGELSRKTGSRGERLEVRLRTSAGIDMPARTHDRLQTVLARMGLNADLTVESTDLPAQATDPDDLTRASDAPGVVVWLADEIEGSGALGRSGNIPGSTLPGPRGLVTISMSLAAGPDGTFDAEEEDALGDAIAHELGHFLGLFHPVELSFDLYDAFSDTPRCTELGPCQDELGSNLMFPIPGTGVPTVTRQQKRWLRQHPAVR